MRWLLVILIVLLTAWYLLPEPDPVPVEESFIAEPVGKLREAEALEDPYLEATEARKRQMEEAIDGDG
ncbi:MAG: hypothetical protein AAGH19_12840 [Pseudomonadota bacterium]